MTRRAYCNARLMAYVYYRVIIATIREGTQSGGAMLAVLPARITVYPCAFQQVRKALCSRVTKRRPDCAGVDTGPAGSRRATVGADSKAASRRYPVRNEGSVARPGAGLVRARNLRNSSHPPLFSLALFSLFRFSRTVNANGEKNAPVPSGFPYGHAFLALEASDLRENDFFNWR